MDFDRITSEETISWSRAIGGDRESSFPFYQLEKDAQKVLDQLKGFDPKRLNMESSHRTKLDKAVKAINTSNDPLGLVALVIVKLVKSNQAETAKHLLPGQVKNVDTASPMAEEQEFLQALYGLVADSENLPGRTSSHRSFANSFQKLIDLLMKIDNVPLITRFVSRAETGLVFPKENVRPRTREAVLAALFFCGDNDQQVASMKELRLGAGGSRPIELENYVQAMSLLVNSVGRPGFVPHQAIKAFFVHRNEVIGEQFSFDVAARLHEELVSHFEDGIDRSIQQSSNRPDGPKIQADVVKRLVHLGRPDMAAQYFLGMSEDGQKEVSDLSDLELSHLVAGVTLINEEWELDIPRFDDFLKRVAGFDGNTDSPRALERRRDIRLQAIFQLFNNGQVHITKQLPETGPDLGQSL